MGTQNENEHDDTSPTDPNAAGAPANGTVKAVRPHRPTNPNIAAVNATQANLEQRPKFDQEWADEAWAAMAPWILRRGPGTEAGRLEDVNMSVVRRETDGTETRIGTIRGHHVAGAVGSGFGDGGPGPALLRRLADVHMGYERAAIYDITISWKHTGHIITKKPMSFPAPRELAQMMRGLATPPTGAQPYDAGRGPSLGPLLDTQYGGVAAAGVGASQYGPTPGPTPALQGDQNGLVGQLFEEMRQMRRENYERSLREYERTGVGQPPAPPPGVAPPTPPSPELLAMKALVEQQAGMIKTLTDALPKPPLPPDPKEKFAREMVVEMLGAFGIKPTVGPNGAVTFASAVGAGVAGVAVPVPGPGMPGYVAPPRPMTMLEAVNKRVAEAHSLLEAREALDESLKAIGVAGAPEVPEVNAELVNENETKPEDELPFRIHKIPTPGGIFGQQEYNLTTAKEGETIGFGQTLINQWMTNPGMQERTIEVASRIIEPLADRLVGLMSKLADATKPGQSGGGGMPTAAAPAPAATAAAQITQQSQRVSQEPPMFTDPNATPGTTGVSGAPPAVPSSWGDE